jgi:hypothetical protein
VEPHTLEDLLSTDDSDAMGLACDRGATTARRTSTRTTAAPGSFRGPGIPPTHLDLAVANERPHERFDLTFGRRQFGNLSEHRRPAARFSDDDRHRRGRGDAFDGMPRRFDRSRRVAVPSAAARRVPEALPDNTALGASSALAPSMMSCF